MNIFRFFSLLAALILIIVQAVSGGILKPTVKWSVTLEVQLDASPVAYPANNPDGVIISTSGFVSRLNGKGEVLFRKFFGPEILQGAKNSEVRLADLNGDGREDIISETNDGFVYALDSENGSTLWKFNLGAYLGMFRFVTTADLDGDGQSEILAPDMNGWLTCLNSRGKLLWRYKSEPYRISTPAVADINNDGRPEIVFGTSTHHLTALTADGNLLWDGEFYGHDFSRTKPVLADADQDGSIEIYSMSCRRVKDQGLISLNGTDGSLRWSAPMTHKAYFTLATADINRDGKAEIIAGDKGTALAAFSAGGGLLWRTRVRGRGMWTSPAVADIDGDGRIEIVVTVRDDSQDEDHFSWYVLNTTGKVLASFPLQGRGYGAPLIADIDRDGILEVVIAARNPGRITAFSFGGPADKKSVLIASQLHNYTPAPDMVVPVKSATDQEYSGKLSIVSNTTKFGLNQCAVDFKFSNQNAAKDDSPVVNISDVGFESTSNRIRLELTTHFPDGSKQIQVFPAQDIPANSIRASWPIYQPGNYQLNFRLIDLKKNSVLAVLEENYSVKNPAELLEKEVQVTSEKMENIRREIEQMNPVGALFISLKAREIEEKFQYFKSKIRTAVKLERYGREKLAREIENFTGNLKLLLKFASLAESQNSINPNKEILLWQDLNPWDNEDPLSELPASVAPLKFSIWALGNEIESACINVANLAPEPRQIRIAPGTCSKTGEENLKLPAEQIASIHKVVTLPARNGSISHDLLPKLGDDYTISLAPGEIRKIWINLNTRDLAAGDYSLNWNFTTLNPEPSVTNLEIVLTVSPVRLPTKSSYSAIFWSQNNLGRISTIPDLNEHLQNVWYRVPLPTATADKFGNISNELDWTAHDRIVKNAGQISKILYHYPVTPGFDDEIQVDAELRKKARQNYARLMLAHLNDLGLDYDDFMFYPQDEPGLVGSIQNYMNRAREIKSIDPNFLVYANPTGGISMDMISEMAPLTDVWQPEMDTIELLGQPYLDAMAAGNKPVWTYTAQDNIRILSSLGFYRGQAWFAFRWGLQGGGYWVYHFDNLWATKPEDEPSYGSVAFDGRSIVTSRRWEATREGIEDYNMLSLLKDALEKSPDPETVSLLEEALNYVGRKPVPPMPREAADTEIDFEKFQNYRKAFRDFLENYNNRK